MLFRIDVFPFNARRYIAEPVSTDGLSFAVVVAFFVPLVGLAALGFLIVRVAC